jgi:hypothetical protein
MMAASRWDYWIWLGFAAFALRDVAGEVRRRKRAGAVLLDLRSNRVRWYGLVGAVTIALSQLVSRAAPRVLWFGLLLLTVGFWLLESVPKRVQLREAGILLHGSLIPWGRIETCEVASIGTLSLKMPGKGWTFCCDVPPELRQSAQELLASRCQALQPKL